MIQIVTNTKTSGYPKALYKISKLDEFEDFNNYEINIIDLSNEEIWKCNNSKVLSLNCLNDLISLNKEIKVAKSKILVIFPQNITYYFDYGYSIGDGIKKYNSSKKIKDMIPNVISIIKTYLIDLGAISIKFGKTTTKIEEQEYKSDFSFSEYVGNKSLLTAINNSSITTISKNNLVFTTLSFDTEMKLIIFLKKIFPEVFSESEEKPDWIEDIDFYNDKKCKDNIIKIDEQIKELEREKKENLDKMAENNKIKSILYETGDNLANEVNNILCQLLGYDMSSFKDNYEEDGIIKFQDITFVIETKGLNSEIKRTHVHQAAGHLMVYRDKIEEEGIIENTKALFFAAYQRKINPNDRVNIDKGQISIAKQNDTLIIDTRVLLKIYEDFKNDKVSTEKFIELLKKSEGELKYN